MNNFLSYGLLFVTDEQRLQDFGDVGNKVELLRTFFLFKLKEHTFFVFQLTANT